MTRHSPTDPLQPSISWNLAFITSRRTLPFLSTLSHVLPSHSFLRIIVFPYPHFRMRFVALLDAALRDLWGLAISIYLRHLVRTSAFPVVSRSLRWLSSLFWRSSTLPPSTIPVLILQSLLSFEGVRASYYQQTIITCNETPFNRSSYYGFRTALTSEYAITTTSLFPLNYYSRFIYSSKFDPPIVHQYVAI